MLIRVMYDNGQFDMVKPQMLDTLLETNRVTSFKLDEGWAVVGRDALRNRHHSDGYKG
jgi:hypothetical protein